MSNYAELYAQVMAFCQQSWTISDPFPGSAVSSSDKQAQLDRLCLRAANNARKKAEQMTDWVPNQVSASVTVPAGEVVTLANLTDIETETTFTGFKNIVEICLVSSDGCEIPVHGQHKMFGLRRKFLKRYYNRARVELFGGNRLRLTPDDTDDVELRIYGYKWMDEYVTDRLTKPQTAISITGTLTSDGSTPVTFADPLLFIGFDPVDDVDYPAWEDSFDNQIDVAGAGPSWILYHDATGAEWHTPVIEGETLPRFNTVWTPQGAATGTPVFAAVPYDWMFEHGFEYLQWQTICELNYQLEIFVPRQEGKLPPPDRQAMAALDTLIQWNVEQEYHMNAKSR